MTTSLPEFLGNMFGKATETGGFARFHDATETPLTLILVARP